MKALHHDHDQALGRVVEPAKGGVTEPVNGGSPRDLRPCVVSLEGIVDQQDVAASPGQRAADRSGEARTPLCGFKFAFRCLLWIEPGLRKHPLEERVSSSARQSRENLVVSSSEYEAQMIRQLGSRPSSQDGKDTETIKDLSVRGGWFRTRRGRASPDTICWS